jgi:hypothetical protein
MGDYHGEGDERSEELDQHSEELDERSEELGERSEVLGKGEGEREEEDGEGERGEEESVRVLSFAFASVFSFFSFFWGRGVLCCVASVDGYGSGAGCGCVFSVSFLCFFRTLRVWLLALAVAGGCLAHPFLHSTTDHLHLRRTEVLLFFFITFFLLVLFLHTHPPSLLVFMHAPLTPTTSHSILFCGWRIVGASGEGVRVLCFLCYFARLEGRGR